MDTGGSRITEFAVRLAKEPPFRVFVKAFLKRWKVSVKTRALWDLSDRPEYLLGVFQAARQALDQTAREMCVIEFGVANGGGLLSLQREAQAVEQETGVAIKVYGFDMGAQGLPTFIGDYRDHPDTWRPGDFPMDEEALRSRLMDRTRLILGNVRDTVAGFFARYSPPPIGFVSIDMDLYSSCREALGLLAHPAKTMLRHVPIYFDDVEAFFLHRFGGELLAIEEFNRQDGGVKIDRWRGISAERPFREAPFLDKFFVAHDLVSISKCVLAREPHRFL